MKKIVNFMAVFCIMFFGLSNVTFAAHVGGTYLTSNPSATVGGYCEIYTRYTTPTATTSSFSTAYIMVCGDATDVYEYVQVGWIRGQNNPVSTVYYFEYSNDQYDWGRVCSTVGPDTNSKHTYKAEFNSYTVSCRVDGVLIGSHLMDWSGIEAIQLMGERSSTSSAFPGKPSKHEFFDVPQYKTSAWHSITTMDEWKQDLYGGLNTSKFNSSNNYRFDIWDTRY